MGTMGKQFLAVLGAVAALGWVAPALADSGLSMPFACRVEAGMVALTPSAPRTYRVYGAPESRMFSNCAPGMPGGCPSLKLQRFDLDCGGTRVSWVSVAEALARYTSNPGYVSDGRFHMMAAPGWRAGPCGPGAPFGYPPRRMMGPYAYAPPVPCAVPYPSSGPRQSVELARGLRAADGALRAIRGRAFCSIADAKSPNAEGARCYAIERRHRLHGDRFGAAGEAKARTHS